MPHPAISSLRHFFPHSTTLLGMTLMMATGMAACGQGLYDETYTGDPLFLLRANVEGTLEATPSSLRASVLWSSLPDALNSCLGLAQDNSDVSVCFNLYFKPSIAAESVAVEPVFPSALEMPMYRLPRLSSLSGREGSWLGYGSVVIFDDGNGNGQLDLVEPGQDTAEDTVVGASLLPNIERDSSGVVVSTERNVLVYREGELSPLWKMFEMAADCPAPPEGLSVYFIDVEQNICERKNIDDGLTIKIDDSDAMRANICRPKFGPQFGYPSDPPPAGAQVTCVDEYTLEFSTDADLLCPLVQRYDLIGCTDTSSVEACNATAWDLTNDIPAWWPCETL